MNDMIELMKQDIEISRLRGRLLDAYFIGGAVGFILGVAAVLAVLASR